MYTVWINSCYKSVMDTFRTMIWCPQWNQHMLFSVFFFTQGLQLQSNKWTFTLHDRESAREGGGGVYRYTCIKVAKFPQYTQNWKWHYRILYIQNNPLYTIHPKTLTNPEQWWRDNLKMFFMVGQYFSSQKPWWFWVMIFCHTYRPGPHQSAVWWLKPSLQPKHFNRHLPDHEKKRDW